MLGTTPLTAHLHLVAGNSTKLQYHTIVHSAFRVHNRRCYVTVQV